METYNVANIIKKLQDSSHILITPQILREYTGIISKATLHRLIADLVTNEILTKLERGKYHLNDRRVTDFIRANILYSPSYISFETALNHHGILSQFPYESTSATPKKSKSKHVDEKLYSYVHIKKSLFWGYAKVDGALLAEPEKALLDQLYISSKGLKGHSIDEYDYEQLNLKKFWQYAKSFPQTAKFQKLLQEVQYALS
ncbi:MAG: hypothetical protein O2840_00925 [bacterium]|nr:hypothetical protein [bacterium]